VNFAEAEAYLYSLGNEVETMKLGLENTTVLLNALGDPQTNYKKVQVAGTNGKGSVCAFLDSICGGAGIRRGLYTSPHLMSITERIRIDGVDISEDDFAHLATRVRSVSETLVAEAKLERVPTYFEQVTAMALLAFAEAGVELAIIETGLGGRYDAVTAAKAEIAAITRIDLDHQEYLGDTIEKIAAEKAAIVHEGSKVVLLHQDKSVERVLLGTCKEVGVDPIWASPDIRITNDPQLLPIISGSIHTEAENYMMLEFWNMLGRHQFQNASVAISLAELLNRNGFKISKDQIIRGMENAHHPGRLEFVRGVLLDGAHNPGGATALTSFLDLSFADRPITVVFGAMRDKSVPEIAQILWPRAERIILTQPSNSRAMTADELASFAPDSVSAYRLIKTNSVRDAIVKAKEITGEAGLILVTGSLYLVGEVKKILQG
jgi:dihydrofolate synthase/folylpolyglutamate synthase